MKLSCFILNFPEFVLPFFPRYSSAVNLYLPVRTDDDYIEMRDFIDRNGSISADIGGECHVFYVTAQKRKLGY